MPLSPPRPCRHRGCPEVIQGGGWCRVHAAERHAAIDSRRGSAHRRGYDDDWRRCRAAFLVAHPLCEECERAGRIESATVVDHVVPIADAPARRLDVTNLRALCKPHHDARTMRDQVGRSR